MSRFLPPCVTFVTASSPRLFPRLAGCESQCCSLAQRSSPSKRSHSGRRWAPTEEESSRSFRTVVCVRLSVCVCVSIAHVRVAVSGLSGGSGPRLPGFTPVGVAARNLVYSCVCFFVFFANCNVLTSLCGRAKCVNTMSPRTLSRFLENRFDRQNLQSSGSVRGFRF